MSNKIEGPAVLPLDQPAWMGATGSVVAQLTKTILAMQEASKGGINMDPALHDLLTQLSQDANNFIGSLNQFCQAIAQACAATAKQIDAEHPKSERNRPPCSPCCSCYSSDSEELDCESLDQQEDDGEAVYPSVVPKESIDVEKACQVRIIEEEFTETSTYTVDPLTNKVKISKIEEYCQLAKCTTMKHQSVQTCKCPGYENGKAEGDGIVHALGESEPIKESTSDANEINEADVPSHISKEFSEHGEEQRKLSRRVSSSSKTETPLETIIEIPKEPSVSTLQSKCKHHKDCCKCEELQKKSPTVSDNLIDLSVKSSPKHRHSISSDQMTLGSKEERSPTGSIIEQGQSSPAKQESEVEKERRSISSDQVRSRSPSISKRGSKEERSPAGSIIEQGQSSPAKLESEEEKEKRSISSDQVRSRSPSFSKRGSKEGRSGSHSLVSSIIEQEESCPTERECEGRPGEIQSCTPSTCSAFTQNSSFSTKRRSNEGQPVSRSAAPVIEQKTSRETKRESKESRPCTISTCSVFKEDSFISTNRRSNEERPGSPSLGSAIEQEPSILSQRDSKEGQPYIPSTCSVIEQEPSFPAKRRSNEESSPTGSIVETESITKQSSSERRSGSILQPSAEPNILVTQRRSKEEPPGPPSSSYAVEQEPSIQSKQREREGGCAFKCCTCSTTQTDPVSSYRETKQSNKEDRPVSRTSTASLTEPYSPASVTKQQSVEERPVSRTSTASLSEKYSPAGVTKQQSIEGRPVSRTSTASLTEPYSPASVTKQQSVEERPVSRTSTASLSENYSPAGVTKQQSLEGRPVSRTSTASLTEPYSPAGVTKQQSIEERPVSRTSTASLTEPYSPAGVTKQQSKEERPVSRTSTISVRETYSPVGVTKQQSKEERKYCPAGVTKRQSRGEPPYSFCCTCSVTEPHPASRYSSDYEPKRRSREERSVLPPIIETKDKRRSKEERYVSPSTDKSESVSLGATAHETKRRSKEEAQTYSTGTTKETESGLPFDTKRKSIERPVSPYSTDSTNEPETFETKRQSKDARHGSYSFTGSISKPEHVRSSEIKRKSTQEPEPVLPFDTKPRSKDKRSVSPDSTGSISEIESLSPVDTKRRSKDKRPVSPDTTGSITEIESVSPVDPKRRSKDKRPVSPDTTGSISEIESLSPVDTKRRSKDKRPVSPDITGSITEIESVSPVDTKQKSREQVASGFETKGKSVSSSSPSSTAGPEPVSPFETKRRSKEEKSVSSSSPSSTAGPGPVSPFETKRKSKEERPVSPYGTDSGTETESVPLTHAAFESKRKSKEAVARSSAGSAIELEPEAKQRSEGERFITSSSADGLTEPQSVSTSVKTSQQGKEEGPDFSTGSISIPKSPFTDVTTLTTEKGTGEQLISIKQLYEDRKRKLSTDQCICTSNEWLGATNSQELQIPPLQDNRINKWVQRLSKTEQTLASIRAKIDNFSTGLPRIEDCSRTCTGRHGTTDEKNIQQSRIRTRQQRSPRPGAALSPPGYDLPCACPDYSDHHHNHRHPAKCRPTTPVKPGIHDRCASPRSASKRRISPATVKQLPLMPPHAIPIQPGVIDNNHQRPYRPRTSKTRNTKIDYCSCDSK